jgi:ribonuclease III
MTSLEAKFGYIFKNRELLEQALTHKSFSFEKKHDFQHNEKLEFLGDAVLDLIASAKLYQFYPLDDEGQLSKKRASLVNEEALALVALDLELPQFLKLGKGEVITGGAAKPRLLASAVEALLGALYLEADFETTSKVCSQLFERQLQLLTTEESYATDYKTRFQEVAQKALRQTPTYLVVSEEGPAHERIFTVSLNLKEETVSHGQGRSKKLAEQNAAKIALELPQWKGS